MGTYNKDNGPWEGNEELKARKMKANFKEVGTCHGGEGAEESR